MGYGARTKTYGSFNLTGLSGSTKDLGSLGSSQYISQLCLYISFRSLTPGNAAPESKKWACYCFNLLFVFRVV